MRIYNPKRSAMTLVELLVVMAIIIIFTAITVGFYPANHADRELSRFSNTVQSSLLSARNRARTERLPTGIRFYADGNPLVNPQIPPKKVVSVVMIQKPAPLDAFVVGLGNPVAGAIVEVESPPMSGNFIYSFPIQGVIIAGDFITLASGDVASFLTNTNPLNFNPLNRTSGFFQNLRSNLQKYKIFRSPIELSGDKPFELSDTIEIVLFGNPTSVTNAVTQANTSWYFDIIFNPDGSLQNSNYNIYLHLHNFDSVSGDAILVVRKMTGSIGVYEVGPVDFVNPSNHNPYLFAKDPRNKGI